jgi:hypothetical protein
MDDRNSQERFDIDVVGLWLQRVPEKNDEIDPPLGDTGPYLLVTAERPAQKPGHLQPQLARQQPTGGAGRVKLVLRKSAGIVPRPFEQIEFAVVVSDQSNPLADIHPQGSLLQHWLHVVSLHESSTCGSNTFTVLSAYG